MIKILPLSICFIFLFLRGNLHGRTIYNMIQYESLFLTQLPALIYLLFVIGLKESINYTQRIIIGSSTVLDDGISDNLISISLISGFISSIFSLLLILSTLSDATNIGHPISLMVFGSLYGVVLPLILIFLRSRRSKVQSHKILAYTTIMPMIICLSVIFALNFYEDADSLNNAAYEAGIKAQENK